MGNIAYDLIKDYPSTTRERNIIRKMVIHNDENIWKRLTKHGIEYTKNEKNEYFPKNINIIGLGSFSTIYELPNNKVLKITNVTDELKWSYTIANLNKKAYVKVFDIVESNIEAKQFGSEYEDKHKVSFIVLEKLYIISEDEIDFLYLLDDKLTIEYKYSIFDPEIDINIIDKIDELEILDKPFDQKYRKLIDFLKIVLIDISNYSWRDLHVGNIMKNKNGDYKIIDLWDKN